MPTRNGPLESVSLRASEQESDVASAERQAQGVDAPVERGERLGAVQPAPAGT
jgi:hypothetical protein